MDLTILFKACVKTVRATNRALEIKEPKGNILKTNQKDANLAKPKEVVKQITYLQNFLLENKAAYLNVLNYLSTKNTLTDVDREQIDTTAEKIVNACTSLINEYRKEVPKLAKSKQKLEHYTHIADSLEQYLKSVSKIYTEAKALRIARVLGTHKLSKLETTPKKVAPSEKVNQSTKTDLNDKSVIIPHNLNMPQPNIDEELASEEMQMFEEENEMLFNELNNLSDEIKHMENKVVHISELQELFTEKVLQQEHDIERIAEVVAGSTENMKDANEQIRQAIQRNAGLRVWFIFFMLVMSFSLLFLDWYND